ncbi:hypothetical protein IGB42_03102 [Andreprevotia sp. IGB-42]|uniref:hypothetical protein n=1 Tax=Andreprevotia sp. IGB-42 TaxID=2497473 RepID=UPI00135808BD|nr:hypothetical protein [Andreprevotia sp. IGB-42]KAF0812434.1 hypothetical protein IGB42_03102 [Andreprevotia sp. IGB-42]
MLVWLGWALAALLTVIVMIAVRNQFDEPLDAKTQAWLKLQLQTVPPEQNGFYYLYGFSAAKGNPAIAGKAWLDQLQTARNEIKYKPLINCPEKDGPCLTHVLEHSVAYRQRLAENEILLDRYRTLLAYSQFDEVLGSIDTNAPNSSVGYTANLYRAQIALDYAAGNTVANQHLLSNLRFWIMALKGSRATLMAMVATAQVKRTLRLIDDLQLENPDTLRPIRKELRTLMAELLRIDTRALIAQTQRSEFYKMGPGWEKESVHLGVFSLFYQANATRNTLRPYFEFPRAVSVKPCKPVDVVFNPINPVGRILICEVTRYDIQKCLVKIENIQRTAGRLNNALQEQH